jgi:MbtH protein
MRDRRHRNSSPKLAVGTTVASCLHHNIDITPQTRECVIIELARRVDDWLSPARATIFAVRAGRDVPPARDKSCHDDNSLLRNGRGVAMSSQDKDRYKVVLNDEGQYSIWFADREIPLGWREAGKEGWKDDCLAYIEEVWTDMRPLSLRKAMADGI